MNIESIRFEKLVVGDEPPRFIVTFAVQFTVPDEKYPYAAHIPVSVIKDDGLSHEKLLDTAEQKLCDLFGALGKLDRDQVKTLRD